MLPQVNQVEKDWWLFFFKNRLENQVALAQKNNRWDQSRQEKCLAFKQYVLKNFDDQEIVPSLLYGDLWSGIVFFDQEEQPVFIDPAISYGDWAQDIAMSLLFGGFRPEFLESYQTIYPLETKWEKRVPIYQLYYFLAHLNMFGESYGAQVDQLLVKR